MIGKGITALIKTDQNIKDLINNGANLYPISDYGKGMDAIYYIIRLVPDYTKNGPTMMKWNVTLLTHCRSYADSWTLTMLLKQLFEKQPQQVFAGFKFITIKCTSIVDDYEFTTSNYGQILQFEITTPYYKVEV